MATNFAIRLLHDLAEKVLMVGCEAHRWSLTIPLSLVTISRRAAIKPRRWRRGAAIIAANVTSK